MVRLLVDFSSPSSFSAVYAPMPSFSAVSAFRSASYRATWTFSPRPPPSWQKHSKEEGLRSRRSSMRLMCELYYSNHFYFPRSSSRYHCRCCSSPPAASTLQFLWKIEDQSHHTRSKQPVSLDSRPLTSIVGAGDGAKFLLTCSIPNLQLTNCPINILLAKAKIHSNSGHVVLHEVLITVSKEQGGFPHSLVPYNHHFEQVIVLLDHLWVI